MTSHIATLTASSRVMTPNSHNLACSTGSSPAIKGLSRLPQWHFVHNPEKLDVLNSIAQLQTLPVAHCLAEALYSGSCGKFWVLLSAFEHRSHHNDFFWHQRDCPNSWRPLAISMKVLWQVVLYPYLTFHTESDGPTMHFPVKSGAKQLWGAQKGLGEHPLSSEVQRSDTRHRFILQTSRVQQSLNKCLCDFWTKRLFKMRHFWQQPMQRIKNIYNDVH